MASQWKVLFGLVAVIVIATGSLWAWIFFYTGDLPETEQLSAFAPKATGHLATGVCLSSLSFAIPFEQIGRPFEDALTSAEPKNTFAYQIAQKLMCNRHNGAARYQLDVFRLSFHIRRRFSDQEIFTIYANSAYFGPAATGINNASQHFFQKEAAALSAPEAALLAGLLRAPAYLTPFKHPNEALRRRNQVLVMMAAQGKVNRNDLADMVAAPLNIQPVGNTELTPLPSAVLRALGDDQADYCDEFEGDFKKGCEETFQANLTWRPLSVTPHGASGILVENNNTGFCGSAGCKLSLFIPQEDGQFAQVLGTDGEVGTVESISVSETITRGHYNLQKTWADGKTRETLRWNGTRYSSE